MSSNRFVLKNTFLKDKFLSKNILNIHSQKTSLPNNAETNLVLPNLFVNSTINLFFNKLLDNDRIISCYIEQIKNKINRTESLISANFKLEDENYNTDNILNKYKKLSSEHIEIYHKENSPIELINKNVSLNDCSNLNLELDEQKLTNVESLNNLTIINNDEVVEFEFESDDSELTFVMAHIYNKATNYKKAFYIMDERVLGNIPSLVKIPYILKKWISGINEIYIYLGTTFTFYNSIPDIDNPTLIEISLSKKHFNINEILDINITGQSFPINIDLSTTNRIYTDKILPSVVTDIENKINDDFYHLYFACYGTDAQAILIKFK